MPLTAGAKVRVQRANFIVRDLETSLKFYRDVLGFEIAFMHESELDSYSYIVFEIDRKAVLQFAVLSTPDAPRCMALTEIKGTTLEKTPVPRRSAVVLEVQDVDAVVNGAKKLGLQVYVEEHLVTNDGREGREVGIVDADENLLVIYSIESHPDTA